MCFRICLCVFKFAFVFSNLRVCFLICVCVSEFAFVFSNLRLCFQICVCVSEFAFVFSNLRLCFAPLGHRNIQMRNSRVFLSTLDVTKTAYVPLVASVWQVS